MDSLTPARLAATIDHALLRADATSADFEAHCLQASTYGFAIVAINPEPVQLCRALLAGTSVGVGAAIAFPLGADTIEVKRRTTEMALADGADEIDYVLNLRALKDGDVGLVEREMTAIVGACRAAAVVSKVIIETCYLTDAEKWTVAAIAREVRPTFLKTSSGFASGGATLADVTFLRTALQGEVALKASSGIKTLAHARAFLAAGCTRLGTSAGPRIIDELRRTS